MNIKAKALATVLIRLLIITVLAVLFLGDGKAAADNTMVCTVTKGQYVNVRTGATSSAASLGRKLHNGDEIEPISVNNGWITINWNGVNAFVQAKYFETVAGMEYEIMANGRVRWRESPGGDVGGYYQPGDVVQVDAFRYGADDKLWARVGSRFIDAAFLVPYETDDEKEFYGHDF